MIIDDLSYLEIVFENESLGSITGGETYVQDDKIITFTNQLQVALGVPINPYDLLRVDSSSTQYSPSAD